MSEQNERRFAEDIFKLIFSAENICILIHISPNFVTNGPIVNKPNNAGSGNDVNIYLQAPCHFPNQS